MDKLVASEWAALIAVIVSVIGAISAVLNSHRSSQSDIKHDAGTLSNIQKDIEFIKDALADLKDIPRQFSVLQEANKQLQKQFDDYKRGTGK